MNGRHQKDDAVDEMLATLAEPRVEVDGEREAQAVLARIRLAESEKPRVQAWTTWLFGGGTLVAAAAALMLWMRPAPEGEFTARGGVQTASLAKKAGVELKVSSDGTQVSGSYRNLLDVPAYALVFAIDASGEIHWIYPSWTDDKRDPASVVLNARTTHHAFADGAVLDKLPRGTMRVISVVTREPRHVSEIENLGQPALGSAALEKHFAGGDVREMRVEIR